jgi:hypothetical protein
VAPGFCPRAFSPSTTAEALGFFFGGLAELEDMADPFEVRMRFTSQLQHLNASVTSAQKAANYALKYRDMDEDLHSCILEQLERVCSLAINLAPESADRFRIT